MPGTRAAQGHCQAHLEPLRDCFERLLDESELGASLAVTQDGEPVLDLWGGHADEARQRPWEHDTLTPVWSTTKTMTSLAALLLVDRSELALDAPVARWWPEFAAAGKGDVRVRHLLSHSSGLAGWDQALTLPQLCDWDDCVARLAAQAPWWAPGTASGYHVWTYGFLVGELVRRITGLRTGEFLRRELFTPLGCDFHIGLPPEAALRVSRVVPPPAVPMDLSSMDPASVAFRTMTNPVPDATVSWRDDWCRADIGAANGHGHARAVALVQTVMANRGETAGRRVLAERTVDDALALQVDGVDLVLGAPLRWGAGWGLSTPATFPFIPPGRIALWGGWGGSMVLADADRRLCMAFVMNRMAGTALGGPSAAILATELYRLLGAGT